MKESLRDKINKDDGKHYQVGNHDLNLKEIIGYSFCILALLVYLLVDKAGFQHGWLGWLFFITGLVLSTMGAVQSERQSNT